MEKPELDLLSAWYELWENNGFGAETPDKLPNGLHIATLTALIDAKLGILYKSNWRIRIDVLGYPAEFSPSFADRTEAVQWVKDTGGTKKLIAEVAEWLYNSKKWSFTTGNETIEKWTICPSE